MLTLHLKMLTLLTNLPQLATPFLYVIRFSVGREETIFLKTNYLLFLSLPERKPKNNALSDQFKVYPTHQTHKVPLRLWPPFYHKKLSCGFQTHPLHLHSTMYQMKGPLSLTMYQTQMKGPLSLTMYQTEMKGPLSL